MSADARDFMASTSEPVTREPGTLTLVSLAELRQWPGLADIPDADPFALFIMDAASEKVRIAAGNPTWTWDTAPMRARQIAWHLAARSYLNPGSLTRENIGPLGEGRSEELAKALHLTTAEEMELRALNPDPAAQGGGTFWVQPISPGGGYGVERDIVIGNVVYADPDDAYAFTPDA